MTRFLLFLPAALLMACDPLPDIGAAPPASAGPPPALLPVGDLLAQTPEPRITPARTDALAARAAGLRQRAGAMRGPVHDPATRERLRPPARPRRGLTPPARGVAERAAPG